MKKILFFIIFVFLVSNVFADDISIYDHINKIKDNPSDYVFIFSESISRLETVELIEISKSIGVKSNEVDDGLGNQESKMILIGNSNINSVTKDIIGEWTLKQGEGVIKVLDNNLLIAGSSAQVNIELLKIVKEYEQNKALLSKDEYYIGNSRLKPIGVKKTEKKEVTEPSFIEKEKLSPDKKSNSLIWWIIGIVVLLGIGGGASVIILKNRDIPSKQPIQNIQSQNRMYQSNRFQPKHQYSDATIASLRNYINQCLTQGYNKRQITQTLISSGWPVDLIKRFLK